MAAILTSVLYAGVIVGGNAGAEPPPVYHTVEPGETLWGITAEHYPPSEDPRPIIEEIRDENGLDGYEIRPGMSLELPATG